MKITNKLLIASVAALALTVSAQAEPDLKNWDALVAEAKGQTVYWNAWGGSDQINAYINWVGETLKADYDVNLVHVKLDDTANAVSAVVAEKTAGKDTQGAIDLIWINGENFASMKREGLLYGPGWVQQLPNWNYVDFETKPTITTDFTIPTDGMESPWGMAKMVFFHDTARTAAADMPDNTDDLLKWAGLNPGRFSYPQPPDFIGSSFVKQVLIEKIADKALLQSPVDDATFDDVTKPLFDYLDKLHPNLWRSGKVFPKDYPSMSQLLADGELEITFAFNPSEASSAIANDQLPDSVRSFTFSGGTLGNTHFVAIPYNSSAKAAALVTANFLISPEAQLRKQDPSKWGDPTVLAMHKLSSDQAAQFAALDLGVATLRPDQLGPAFDEPHPSWMAKIETKWASRYGVAN